MTQMQNARSVAFQLEKVRDKLPSPYERDDILMSLIQQRSDVERVSSRNMRLPLQNRPAGKAGPANKDGDDLGRGSGTLYDVAQVTPVFFRHAVEITKLVEYASNASEKAIENTASHEVKNAMAQVPLVSGQSDADQRQRGARGDRFDHDDGIAGRSGWAIRDGQAAGRAALLLQPDRADVRPDVDDGSRFGQRFVGGSVQFAAAG